MSKNAEASDKKWEKALAQEEERIKEEAEKVHRLEKELAELNAAKNKIEQQLAN